MYVYICKRRRIKHTDSHRVIPKNDLYLFYIFLYETLQVRKPYKAKAPKTAGQKPQACVHVKCLYFFNAEAGTIIKRRKSIGCLL